MVAFPFENVEKLTQHFVEPVIFLVAELQLETEFPLEREKVRNIYVDLNSIKK